MTEANLVTLPPELAAAVRAAAQADGQSPEEWIVDAAAQKLQKREFDTRWQRLVASTQEHARRHGFLPEDVEKAIHDHRCGR